MLKMGVVHTYIYLLPIEKKNQSINYVDYIQMKIFLIHMIKKIFYGKAGSCFFVDGYGLHKGETPYLKPRLMINIHLEEERSYILKMINI